MSTIKTEMQIERDFFTFVKKSALGQAIKGTVYRSEMRPADAQTEDLVVKFYTGIDSQIQTGTVILDLYVPDVPYGKCGRKVSDKQRIGVLQELVLSFVEDNADTEYWMETETSPYTIEVEDIEQHCIKTRIKFNRLTQ